MKENRFRSTLHFLSLDCNDETKLCVASRAKNIQNCDLEKRSRLSLQRFEQVCDLNSALAKGMT